MRALAIAAIAGLGIAALSGSAIARDWTDPAGRMTFTVPDSWTVEPQPADGFTYAMAFTGSRECHFIAMPGEGSANVPVNRVRHAGGEMSRFTTQQWTTVANSVPPVFPDNSAQFESQSVDSAGYWPIQRAELRNPERAVHGAIQLRPGLELWTFCMTFDGADSASNFDAIIRSVGTPTDAALQAESERLDAAAPPAPPAATPPPAAN